jgi:hypothetical protein
LETTYRLCSRKWEDRWIDEQDVATIAPYLYQTIPLRVRHKQTVREGLHNRTLVRSIASGSTG